MNNVTIIPFLNVKIINQTCNILCMASNLCPVSRVRIRQPWLSDRQESDDGQSLFHSLLLQKDKPFK